MDGIRSCKNALFVRFALAATLFNFSYFLVSYSVYPAFSMLASSVRYIATFGGGVALVLLVVAAFRAPRLLDFRMIEIAVVIALVGGGLCSLLGLEGGNVALLVAGTCCSLVARDAIDVLLGLAIASLPRGQIVPCIACSFFTAWLLQLTFSQIPWGLAQALYVLLPLVPLFLVSKQSALLFPKLQKATSPAEVSATQPMAFLPFGHQLFMCAFLFMLAYGFTLGFGEGEGGSPHALNLVASVLLLGVLALVALARRTRLDMDRAFALASLLVVAGLIFVPYGDLVFDGFPNMLLAAGSNCFRVLIWCAFALIAHGNKLGGVIAFSWGRALIAFGVATGSFLGRAYNGFMMSDGQLAAFASAVAGVALVGYLLLSFKGFSLSSAVRQAEVPPKGFSDEAGSTIEASCERLGELYGLTPREIEVLMLVARGRNAPFIEEKLVISRNTVKSHVKHLYRKLDVHTNQELIDLVERTGNGR